MNDDMVVEEPLDDDMVVEEPLDDDTFATIRDDGADDGGVARITRHRPETLNAFTNRMQRELVAAFDAIDGDAAVRAVVVTGQGRAFCAGADLSSGERSLSGARRPPRGSPWWPPDEWSS